MDVDGETLRDLRRAGRSTAAASRARSGGCAWRSSAARGTPRRARADAERWPTTSASRCSSRTSCATCARTPRTAASTCPPRTCGASVSTARGRGRRVLRSATRRLAALAAAQAGPGELVRFEAERAREWFERGLRARCRCSTGAARACVLAMAGIYRRLLERIEADPRRRARGACRCRRARRRGSRARSLAGGAARERRARRRGRRRRWPASRRRSTAPTAGAEVTLLEVRPRLGGAAYSFERDGLRDGQRPARVPALLPRLPRPARAARLGGATCAVQPRLEIPVLAPGARPSRAAPQRAAGAAAPRRRARCATRTCALRERAAARGRAALALMRIDEPEDRGADARDARRLARRPRAGRATPSRRCGT